MTIPAELVMITNYATITTVGVCATALHGIGTAVRDLGVLHLFIEGKF